MEVRRAVIARVADAIPDPPRPLLVAVDGVAGAGKTTFADELASELRGRGMPVERASVDDFRHPRAHRHELGRTATTVWSRSFDYRTLRRELLDPWLAGGGATYRASWHDVRSDERSACEPRPVPESGVLVVDGVFAQRAELANAWDFVVFLDVPFAVSVSRLAARDGSPADPDHPDQQRYVAAQRHYFECCAPREAADVVIDNSDLSAPRFTGAAIPEVPPGWRIDGDDLVRTIRLPREAAAIAATINSLL